MPLNVTSALRESTVQVENQNPEVTVHQDITVQVVHEWQNSFRAQMARTIHIMQKQVLTSVLTALRVISARREQFNLCHVL